MLGPLGRHIKPEFRQALGRQRVIEPHPLCRRDGRRSDLSGGRRDVGRSRTRLGLTSRHQGEGQCDQQPMLHHASCTAVVSRADGVFKSACRDEIESERSYDEQGACCAEFSRDAPAERFLIALGKALRWRVAAKLGRQTRFTRHMITLPIYLDYNATTPVDPRVVELMTTYLTRVFGNAASKTHAYGRAAEDAVLRARNQVAALLNVEQDDRLGAREIVFTSGATEANNLAIKGVADQYRDRGKHIITQVTEHSSVLGTCKRLAERGYEVTYLPVDSSGRVSPQQIADAIRPDTILVSIMYANNETGVIQPMDAIGKICKERGVLFHTDATQALGKIPIDVHADGIDLLACSAHKLYGPKGVGALYVRKRDPRVRLTALIDGGGHERGFRSGTLNVPGIAALGLACEIAGKEMGAQTARLSALRDRLVESAKKLGGVRV